MNVKKCILLVISFLTLALSGCGGHSEYYEKGYKNGYSEGQENVRNVWRISDDRERRLISNDIFDASTAFELEKQSSVWGLSEDNEPEYRSGYIDGFNQGVEDELSSKGVSSSGSKKKSSSSSSSSSESSSNSSSNGTGVSFWQWLIIFAITGPIVYWLGLGAFFKNDDDESESKDDKSTPGSENNAPVIESDEMIESEPQGTEMTVPVSEKDESSSEVITNERIFVSPWKSLMLVIFTMLFVVVMCSRYELTISNWSSYIMYVMSFISLIVAFNNADDWAKYKGKSALCSFVKIVSGILALIILVLVCNDLYELIF